MVLKLLEPAKVQTQTEAKKARFQIVKLEERIAPHRVCYRPYHGAERVCLRHQQHG